MSLPVTMIPDGLEDGLRRTLFAQVPNSLMNFLEGEMARRKVDGQAPVQKNVIVAQMLALYQDLVNIATARRDGAPLSKEEAARLRQWLTALNMPIPPKKKRKS